MLTVDFIVGLIALGVVAFLLRRKLRKDAAHLAQKTEGLFGGVLPLLAGTTSQPGESAGSWVVTGNFEGETFQLRSIIDTLATRKLPSLWLQVTLPKPQAIAATVDIMRRSNGPTTFSNFEFLPHIIGAQADLPEDAAIRSDGADVPSQVLAVVKRHASIWSIPRTKELLISPRGVRIVLQVSEGDRLRHGVFRQADFGEAAIDPEVVKQTLAALIALDKDLQEAFAHG